MSLDIGEGGAMFDLLDLITWVYVEAVMVSEQVNMYLFSDNFESRFL